jgi:hypothetical protein
MQLTPKGAAARLFQYPRPVSILFFCNWRVKPMIYKTIKREAGKDDPRDPSFVISAKAELAPHLMRGIHGLY